MKKEVIFSKRPFPFLISLISCVLWGSAFPVLKISYQELRFSADDVLGRIALGGIRFFLASLLLLFVTGVIFKESLRIKRNSMLKLFLLGIFQTGVMYILFYNGVANTTGMKSSIIGGLETFFTIIIAHFIYENDRIDRNKALGILFGFSGLIISSWGQGLSGGFTFQGEGFLILSSLIGALSAIYVKKISKDINPFIITSFQMLFGSILMLIIGSPRLVTLSVSFTPLATGLLIYSAFLSAISFALWYMLLKYNKAGEISIYRFIIPVSGAVLSAIFIPGESFTIKMLVALAFVALGIMLANGGRLFNGLSMINNKIKESHNN